jgi:hypothetical protein
MNEMQGTPDTVLDGNALAGALSEIFITDATTAIGQCANCLRTGPIAETRVYASAPGLVARCPSCEKVVVRVVRAPGAGPGVARPQRPALPPARRPAGALTPPATRGCARARGPARARPPPRGRDPRHHPARAPESSPPCQPGGPARSPGTRPRRAAGPGGPRRTGGSGPDPPSSPPNPGTPGRPAPGARRARRASTGSRPAQGLPAACRSDSTASPFLQHIQSIS